MNRREACLYIPDGVRILDVLLEHPACRYPHPYNRGEVRRMRAARDRIEREPDNWRAYDRAVWEVVDIRDKWVSRRKDVFPYTRVRALNCAHAALQHARCAIMPTCDAKRLHRVRMAWWAYVLLHEVVRAASVSERAAELGRPADTWPRLAREQARRTLRAGGGTVLHGQTS